MDRLRLKLDASINRSSEDTLSGVGYWSHPPHHHLMPRGEFGHAVGEVDQKHSKGMRGDTEVVKRKGKNASWLRPW